MPAPPVISFLTDNNCPDSIGEYLKAQGHDVVRVREIMADDAPDPIVADAAIQAGRVLVGWDKDFNHQRFKAARFAALFRIGFSCPEVTGVARLAELIELVEFEHARASPERPMVIRISATKCTSER